MEMIKAEMVNEMEIEKEDNGQYKDHYPAVVAIKVRNSVSEIKAEYYDEEVHMFVNPRMIETLKELDLDLDYKSITSHYHGLVNAAMLYNAKNKIQLNKSIWNNLWVHNAKNWVEENHPEVEVKLSITKEKFLERNNGKKYSFLPYESQVVLHLTYQKQMFSLTREEVSTPFYSSRSSDKFRFSLSDGTLHWKTRKYKNYQTALPKLVILTKEYLKIKKSKDDAKKESENRNDNLYNQVWELLENSPVKVEKNVDSNYSRYGNHYSEVKNLIVKFPKEMDAKVTMKISNYSDSENFEVALNVRNLNKEKLRMLVEVLS